VSVLQLRTLLTDCTDKRQTGQIRIRRTTVDRDVGALAALSSLAAAQAGGRGGGRGALPPAGDQVQELAKWLWRVTGTTHHSLILSSSTIT
jgi:hypothetical protein